ncbi:MAG: hypothetical protein EOP39_06420 [Rubrivivax sp.]|nr:MAG: hypothetical protein EOP39_06420 [Rubrivivax sp.]
MIVLPLEAPAVIRHVLLRWRAWEVQVPNYDAPSWHLAGYLSVERCAKVSSALDYISAPGDEARSKTGSVYDLLSPPGADEDAERLWKFWQRKHRVTVLRDVTAHVLAGHQPRVVRLIQPVASEDMAASLRGQRKW